MERGQIYIGLSGGVDSSVAALLLQQAGYPVAGIHLQLLQGLPLTPCASDTGPQDAQAIADRLGIPFYTSDLSDTFRASVVSDFAAAYAHGYTPNPCVVCNRVIKFGAMLEEIRARGGTYVATGHYARIRHDEVLGRWQLLRGADQGKDQSYFLYGLSQEQLAHTRFPLGELTKEEVRRIAEENSLLTARKRDSQDLCFVPDGDYAAFLERLSGSPSPAGAFLDPQGDVLGQHKGFIRYTRGQHKGLGLPIEPPLYVLDKDPETFSVTLGPNELLFSRELLAEQFNWVSVSAPAAPIRVTAKTRHSRREDAASAEVLPDGRVRVTFDEPQRAVTPGQSVVLYDGELVLGGGIICRQPSV